MSGDLRGPLPASTAYLCIDMQNLFAQDTPWRAPWMDQVRPVVARLARFRPAANIFTRFIPLRRPSEASGTWRAYFERWHALTRDEIDPRLLDLVPELRELVPPATVFDQQVHSPFHGGRLAAALHERGLDGLVVSGTETDVRVLAAALDAVDHGFRVVIASDALCNSADETHDVLHKLFHERFGLQIEAAPTDAILAAWR